MPQAACFVVVWKHWGSVVVVVSGAQAAALMPLRWPSKWCPPAEEARPPMRTRAYGTHDTRPPPNSPGSVRRSMPADRFLLTLLFPFLYTMFFSLTVAKAKARVDQKSQKVVMGLRHDQIKCVVKSKSFRGVLPVCRKPRHLVQTCLMVNYPRQWQPPLERMSGRWTLQRLLISLAFTSLFANILFVLMPDKEDRCHALLQAARDDAEGLRRELSLERKRAYLAIASHTPSLAEQCNREAGQCRGPPDSILEGEVRNERRSEGAGGMQHEGLGCWQECQKTQGQCAWCGTGFCCRHGWHNTSHGCNGTMGIPGKGHVCIPKYLDIEARGGRGGEGRGIGSGEQGDALDDKQEERDTEGEKMCLNQEGRQLAEEKNRLNEEVSAAKRALFAGGQAGGDTGVWGGDEIGLDSKCVWAYGEGALFDGVMCACKPGYTNIADRCIETPPTNSPPANSPTVTATSSLDDRGPNALISVTATTAVTDKSVISQREMHGQMQDGGRAGERGGDGRAGGRGGDGQEGERDGASRLQTLVKSGAKAATGVVLCTVVWDATALLGNPLAVPGLIDNALCGALAGLGLFGTRSKD